MSDKNPMDPFAMWRDMLGQWEKGMNTAANKTMASGDFSREMNRVLGASLQMKKARKELLTRYFDALNLPTKDDLNALGERLQAMEEQIVRVADAVGSGDAFTAAFISGCLRRWPLSMTARFANEMGALVASCAGAMPTLGDEVLGLVSMAERNATN